MAKIVDFLSVTLNSLNIPSAWKSEGKRKDDYAVAISNQSVSSGIGLCGIASTSRNLVDEYVELPGYPAYVNGAYTEEMHTCEDIVAREEDSRLFYYVDTSGGNSGGPVFWNGAYLAGIHAYGTSSENSGRRLDAALKSYLSKYR